MGSDERGLPDKVLEEGKTIFGKGATIATHTSTPFVFVQGSRSNPTPRDTWMRPSIQIPGCRLGSEVPEDHGRTSRTSPHPPILAAPTAIRSLPPPVAHRTMNDSSRSNHPRHSLPSHPAVLPVDPRPPSERLPDSGGGSIGSGSHACEKRARMCRYVRRESEVSLATSARSRAVSSAMPSLSLAATMGSRQAATVLIVAAVAWMHRSL